MKHKLVYVVTLLTLLFISGASWGQLKEANDLFDNFEYREAIPYFQRAGELDDENQTKYAYCFLRIHDYENAAKQFQKVVAQENVNPINFHFYGITLKNTGKFDEAKEWFEKYKLVDSTDFYNNLSLRSLSFQEKQFNAPQRLSVSNVDKVNSGLSEFCPRFYKNGILFCDEVKFDESEKRPHIDYGDDNIDPSQLEYGTAERPLAELYYMPIENGTYGQPVLIAADEHFHIGDFDLDEVTGEIYFTKVDVINAWRPDGRSHPRLFKAKIDLENKTLVDVEKVKIKKLHNEDGSGHPALSADGKTMYFSSDRPGGYGGSDLYFTTKQTDGTWSEPINLGEKINTKADELFPYLYDDRTLYFSSGGHIGFGELDLFKASVAANQVQSVEILPRPLNSEADDLGILISPDNPDEGFVISNRYHGGFGDDDMFSFKLKMDDSYVQGVVRNQDGTIAEGALVKLLDENGVEIAQLKTDENGKYMFDVDPDKSYKIVATTNGHSAEEEIVINESWDSETPLDMLLMPTDTVQGVVKNQDGTIASDVDITLYDENGNLLVKSKTDEDGRYQFALQENNKYEVVATTDGYQGSADIHTDESWDTYADTDITLLPTELVQGIITDQDGNPVAGALVKILDENGVEVAQVKTDENGHYDFNVPPGNYTLVASTDGHGAKRDVLVDESWDSSQNVNMTLQPTDTVQGIVLNEDGSPSANTSITLFDENGNLLVKSKTDEEGHYQFVLEEDKAYDLVAEKPKGGTNGEDLEGSKHIVTDSNWDTSKQTDIQLGPKTSVSGIVRDENGNPVSGAVVKLYDDEGNVVASTTTGANGKYKFVLEEDQNYQIVASTDGFEGVENIYTGENWDSDKLVDVDLKPSGRPTAGLVTDNKDGSAIDKVKVILVDNSTDKKVVVYTDANGEFNIALSPNTDYTLNLEKDGYYPKSITVKAGSELPDRIDLNKDYNLGMDYAGYSVDRIYFEYDEFTITSESKTQLDKLVEVMKSDKRIQVYIRSYADCRGGDTYNRSLSWKRSKAVKSYLVKKGIASSRIATKSMGATNFVNNCIHPEDCSEQEHALNRRSEFELKFP